jgi:hypothetical protein
MYSRYIPRPDGGYDRRFVPDPPVEPQATGNRQQATGDGENKLPPESDPPGPPLRPPTPAGVESHGPRPAAPRPPPRPSVFGTVRPPGGLFGPNGLLGGLLPRGIDTEDLLILAVLLLAMKQDGAAPMELLIAAALYLWL